MENSEKQSGFDRLWLLIQGSLLWRLLQPTGFLLHIPEESGIDRAFVNSRILQWIDWLLHLVPNLFAAVYRRFPKTFEESRIFSVLIQWSDNMGAVAGVFLALVLCVPQSYWNNFYSLVGALFLFLLLMLRMARTGKRLETRSIGLWFLLFALCVVLAFVASESRRLSLRFLLFHFTCMLLFLTLLTCLEDRTQLKYCVLGLLAGLAVAALFGCYQARKGVDVVLWQVDTDANAGMPGRVYSMFENPNVFAEVLLILTPFTFAMLPDTELTLERLLLLLVLIASVIAMAATYSRGGWIGLVAAILVFAGLKNWRVVPLLLVLIVLAIPLLPDTIFNRLMTLTSGGDSTITSRSVTYASALKLLLDNVLTGVGLGTDVPQQLINGHAYYSHGLKFIHSHNTYLQIWLEMGPVALVAFGGGILNWFKRSAAQAVRPDRPRDLGHYIAAGVAGILGVLVFGLVDYIWFYPRVMLIFWAVVALTAAAARMAARERGEEHL